MSNNKIVSKENLQAILANFKTKVVESDTGTLAAAKTYADELIAYSNSTGFSVEIVDTLPTANIKEKTIYLVPKNPAGIDNIYTEYIHINGKWEIIGDTTIDLSDYDTSTKVDEKITDATSTLSTNVDKKIADATTVLTAEEVTEFNSTLWNA